MTQSPDRSAAAPPLGDALDALLRFGTAMLRAGDTAFRVRERMGVLARKIGLDALSVSLTLGSVTAMGRRGGEQMTMLREIEPPGVDAWRIRELERLAQTVSPGLPPGEIAARIAEIEAAPPRYSAIQTAAAVGVACGAFAFLNDASAPDVLGAAIGGGGGLWLRSQLARRQFNEFGAAASCAAAASAIYCAISAASSRVGFTDAGYSAGFVSSVLFLVPGFSLVAALLDLLQYQTAAAVSRFAYSAMILLAAAFGLSIVIAAAGFDVTSQPSHELAQPLKLLSRGAASLAGGCGFALLFNCSARAVLAVGLLALAANGLRLGLLDQGMMPAPATFLGALAVGLLASLMHRRLDEPRIALAVPGIIIMVPGLSAFRMVVLLNQGHMLDALQAAASCGFIIGAMAMGLAVARFLGQRWWDFER